MKKAANVHVHGFLERAEVGVQHVAELRVGGCIVDQNVQTPELLPNLREDAAYLFHFADMTRDCSGLAAVCNDCVGDGLTPVDFATGHDDMGALLCQQAGNGLTDPATGAGNESDFAVEVEELGSGHVFSLF